MERTKQNAKEECHSSYLGCSCEKGGNWRRCTFIDVRCPHVEGHGRYLESQCRNDEDETNKDTDGCGAVRVTATIMNGAGYFVETVKPVKQ